MAWQLNNMVTPTGLAMGGEARPRGGGLQLEDMEHLAAQSTLLEGTKRSHPIGTAVIWRASPFTT